MRRILREYALGAIEVLHFCACIVLLAIPILTLSVILIGYRYVARYLCDNPAALIAVFIIFLILVFA